MECRVAVERRMVETMMRMALLEEMNTLSLRRCKGLCAILLLGLLLFGGCARQRPPLSVSFVPPAQEAPPAPPPREAPDMWPVAHAELRLTSFFGEVRSGGREHRGLDIALPRGTPVFATASGITAFSGVQGGYGKLVIIDHRNGYETVYAHLDEIWTCRGDRVERGATIGLSGNTGNSTGPHLHYEIRRNGIATDPVAYLPNNDKEDLRYAIRDTSSGHVLRGTGGPTLSSSR